MAQSVDPFAELPPEQAARLKELREALQQEFSEKSSSKASTITEVADLKDDALEALRHVVKFSPSENLKARVSMWVLDTILDDQKAEDETGILKFLRGLEEAKSSTPS